MNRGSLRLWRIARAVLLGALLAAGGTPLLAQAQQAPSAPASAGAGAAPEASVGEVTFAQGAVSAQRKGEPARFLIQGDAIGQGEVISTSARGFAQIGLRDGTRMTLRPNTQFAVTQFSQRPGEENIAMQLLRGGLRAITGLVSKAGPDRLRLQTSTATIGVRGTGFDARLCEGECRTEQRAARAAPQALPQESVIARIGAISGSAVAINATGTPRPLTLDAALFTGETVRTAAGSWVVLAFRDRSVITLSAASDLRLEDVRFRPQQPGQESFVVRLLTGGLRALTGQIAARNPRSVRFQTTTATIGVRGTGLDMRLAEHCIASECSPQSTFAFVWSQSIVFFVDPAEVDIPLDRAGVFNPGTRQVLLLEAVPDFFRNETAPRPDQVKIDFERLFALAAFEDAPPGLYVGVRDGNVSLLGPDGVVDLGPLESGFLGEGSRRPVRFASLPAFLFNDPFPTPDIPGSKVRVLPLIGLGREAGSTACEVR
ncbi:MAG: FecR domain-containing protein [bacterium]